MKAFKPEDLQSILDTELVWRRREISSLVTQAKSVSSHDQMAIIRAAVPLLYAHWEGFGKECFTRYLEYISYRRLKFKQLAPSFLYLSSIASLSGLGDKPVSEGILAIDGLIGRMDATNKDTFRKRVNTKSNLRSDVLDNLLSICGLQIDDFKEHTDFIDRELCDSRNEIAHGSGSAPSLTLFLERRERAFAIMTQLQAMVINAAVAQSYKR